MKLKPKIKNYINYLKIGLQSGLLLGLLFAFLLPNYALAKCSATDYGGGIISNICDGLTITISPATAKVGDTVTINYSVTDPQLLQQYGSVGKTLHLGICKSQNDLPNCAQAKETFIISQPIGNVFSGNFPYQIGGLLANASAPQTYSVGAYIGAGSASSGEGSTEWDIVGPTISLAVSPAGNTTPQIQVKETQTFISGGVNKRFTITYLNGGTSNTVNSYIYNCDLKGTGDGTLNKDVALQASAVDFICVYPLDKKDYAVSVTATLSDGSKISASPAVSITGNEQTQGEGKIGSGGSPLAGFIKEVLTLFLGIAQEFIYAVFFYLVAPVIQAMLSIHPYTDTFVAVIYPGWEIVRNICNIFFILALIIIALATLFRVESYQYRHLLVQLIIAALLINFSLVIGQAILGLADTVQAQFLPANVTVIRSLAGDLMVNSWRDEFMKVNIINGQWADVVKPLFFLALSLGSFAVFTALAIFLVIRIVALWILLLISPIAYACGVLPSTASYRSQWWQQFLKYAFFTPIMAFFINLAAVISNLSQQTPILQAINADSLKNELGKSDFATFVFRIASNIIILVFLLVALKVAEQAGIYGAAGITSMAQKGIFAPFAAAGWLGKAGGLKIKKEYDKRTSGLASGGWLARQAFKALHAPSFVKAIREESQKERELYAARVGAGATEVARKQFGWRRKTESPMFLFDEHKGKELYEEEEGEWSDNEQQVMGVLNRLAVGAKNGNLRDSVKLKHALKEAFRHRNLNEAMEGENGLAKNFLGGKLNYNANNIRYFFQKMNEEGYLDKGFTEEFLKKLGKDGYETGDFNGVELAYSDPETGHPHLIEMDAPVNGNSLPKGWNNYVAKRDLLINKADTDGRTEAAAKGVTDEEKIGVIIANKLGGLEKEAAKDHNYANSMHAERARMFMKVNMSKKTGTAQVGMFHDSIVNVGVEDGEVNISDAGTEVFGHMDAGKMYAMGRDNMPAKTKDKFMRYINAVIADKNLPIAQNRGLNKIDSQLTTIITAKYRENGVLPKTGQIAKEVAEQRNLWLAAGYSILSSVPGPTVYGTFKAQVGENETQTRDRVRQDLINNITAYKKS